MVASANSIGNFAPSADVMPKAATQGTDSLGKDAFLKLLVTQMKNQDPLKPTDNTAMIAQLAQFSSLEQSQQFNTNLAALSTQNKAILTAQSVNYIGGYATASSSKLVLDGSGTGTTVKFTLGSAAQSTKVQIQDSNGNVVRTLDAGGRAAGSVAVTWDGKSDNGLVQPAGTYTANVIASGANGAPVSASQTSSGKVTSISFSNGEAVLNLDSGASVRASDLIRVDTKSATP